MRFWPACRVRDSRRAIRGPIRSGQLIEFARVQMRAHGYIRHIVATRGTLNISSFSCGYSRGFAPLSLPHELHCSTAMHREAARDCAGAVEGIGRRAAEELEVKKCWSGACAALMVSISAFAHAQASATPVAASTAAASANPGWNGDGTDHVTRAQVRHELVAAERDGQLKRLDSTVYAHH
jgi:hypothetical protein